MEFCEDCNNMLYLKIIKTEDSESKLEYNCKNCNYSCDNSNKDSCVFSTNYNMDNIKKESFINKYVYEDITLPRAVGIKCPNSKCPKKDPEIIYIKYDDDNMKFIYICLDCYRGKIEPHIW